MKILRISAFCQLPNWKESKEVDNNKSLKRINKLSEIKLNLEISAFKFKESKNFEPNTGNAIIIQETKTVILIKNVYIQNLFEFKIIIHF